MTSRFFAGATLSALLLLGCSDTESVAGGDDFPNSVQTIGVLVAAQLAALTGAEFPEAELPEVEPLAASGGVPLPAPDDGDDGAGPSVDWSDTAAGVVTVRSGGETLVALWDDDARAGEYNVLSRVRTARTPDGEEIRETVVAEDGSAFLGPHASCGGARLLRAVSRPDVGGTSVTVSAHEVPGCDPAEISRENEAARTTTRYRGGEPSDSVVHEDADGDGLLVGSSGSLVRAVSFRTMLSGEKVRDTVLFRAYDDVRENHVVSWNAEFEKADGSRRLRRLVSAAGGEPVPGDSVSLEDTLSTADGYAGRGEVRFLLPSHGRRAMVFRSEMELRDGVPGGEVVFFEARPETPFPMGEAQNDGSLVIRADGAEPWDMELGVSDDGFEGAFRPGDRGGERPVLWDRDGRPKER